MKRKKLILAKLLFYSGVVIAAASVILLGYLFHVGLGIKKLEKSNSMHETFYPPFSLFLALCILGIAFILVSIFINQYREVRDQIRQMEEDHDELVENMEMDRVHS